MRRILPLLYLLFCLCHGIQAQQQLYNGTGTVSFAAGAPLSLIKGTSAEAVGTVSLQSHKLYFEVPVASFQFANSMMQERFNDKYMDSKRFPKAVFEGELTEAGGQVEARGTLTVHGVSRRRNIAGTLVRQGDRLLLKTDFTVNTSDHHIAAPKLTGQSMAEQINVQLEMLLLPVQGSRNQLSINHIRRVR